MTINGPGPRCCAGIEYAPIATDASATESQRLWQAIRLTKLHLHGANSRRPCDDRRHASSGKSAPHIGSCSTSMLSRIGTSASRTTVSGQETHASGATVCPFPKPPRCEVRFSDAMALRARTGSACCRPNRHGYIIEQRTRETKEHGFSQHRKEAQLWQMTKTSTLVRANVSAVALVSER